MTKKAIDLFHEFEASLSRVERPFDSGENQSHPKMGEGRGKEGDWHDSCMTEQEFIDYCVMLAERGVSHDARDAIVRSSQENHYAVKLIDIDRIAGEIDRIIANLYAIDD